VGTPGTKAHVSATLVSRGLASDVWGGGLTSLLGSHTMRQRTVKALAARHRASPTASRVECVDAQATLGTAFNLHNCSMHTYM